MRFINAEVHKITSLSTMATKIKYGVDAPGIIRTFFLAGGAAWAGAWLAKAVLGNGPASKATTLAMGVLGLPPMLLGGTMLLYAHYGKFRHRSTMLNQIDWQGNEQVLDIGTGRGFLLVGAAERVPKGHVTGIDVWSDKDLSGNGADAARTNAALAGVSRNTTIATADATAMPFASEVFDVVLSLLCLHNIEGPGQMERACTEIARVLKPGGKAVLSDYTATGRQAAALQSAGLHINGHTAHFLEATGPMRHDRGREGGVSMAKRCFARTRNSAVHL